MATTKRKNSTAARSTSGTKVVRAHRPVNTRQRAAALAVSAAFMQSMWVQPIWAAQPAEPTANLPTGGKWANNLDGTAGGTIKTPTATEMQLYQNQRAGVVDFNCFCSRQGTLINLTAPSTDSTTLIRSIEGANLWGRFTANDKVFITSSAGVYFSPTASVDVNSLIATSLSIANADFFAGRYNFSKDGSAGSVVNDGQINILSVGGYAVLAGPQVQNNGVIVARAGTVSLAAGDRVTLDMVGDGLIKVSVDAAALNALALNSGSIEADGGRVVLTARSANALLDSVINNTGMIRAKSLVERGGEIVLDGGGAGIVANSGTLDVSGTDAGAKGGNVAVLGQYVALANGTRIDASGDVGGGNVNVGGSFQGKGPLANASKTIVARDASINADAITRGNGGNVVVWSDNATQFYGTISARGGAQSGDGGNVEVSGKELLRYAGVVDTTAAKGKNGTLLLDPTAIDIIDGAAGAGDQDAELDNNGTITFANVNKGTNTLTVGEIESLDTDLTIQAGGVTFSNTGSITIQNKNSLTITADSTTAGGGTNDITSTKTFTLTTSGAGSNVTLLAGGSIDLANVTLSTGTSISATATAGSVTLGAATTATGGSDITIVAGTNVTLNGALTTNGGNITVDFSKAATGTFSTTAGLTGTTVINSNTTGSTFDLSGAPAITATLNGTTNGDTVKGRNTTQTWAITGNNAGTVGGLTFNNVSTIVGGNTTDTISRGSRTWSLTGADAGNFTTAGLISWTSIENLTDTGTGTFNMHSGADGSLSGNLSNNTNGVMHYTGYTTAVTFNLNGTANKTTGITGTVSGITSVTGNAAATDTITNTTGAATWNLTGANTGNNGTISWTSFGNLSDTGAGTFNMHSGADGSVTGNISAAAGKMSFANYTTAVQFDLAGTANQTTGVTGTATGFATLVGSGQAAGDTIQGTGQTYTVTGAQAGNITGTSWTAFENLTDTTTGTLRATSATWTLDGANTGTVTNLSGAFTGMGNLTDLGASGTFNMHGAGDGSITGSLVGGTASGKVSYVNYTTAVQFDLSGTANKTTGVGGTVTKVTSVTGPATGADTITGTAQTYTVTGAQAGNNGTISWTSFENLSDTTTGTLRATSATWTLDGANTGTVTNLSGTFTGMGNLTDLGASGTFNMHGAGDGSITGNLVGGTASGKVSYVNYTTAVQFDLSGTANKTTGVGGSVTKVTSVTGPATGADTISGTGQTYTVTGAQAGNNGTISWTSFENLSDTGTGTLKAATATWTLNGAGTGTVTNLSGTFTGIANLQDTGTGSFNMHGTGDGSITGTLNGGGSGTLNYAGYTTPVTLNLNGTGYAGITGAVSNISTVVGSGNSDTVAGATQTYNLTGADTGNNGTISWSSFENLTNTGAGTFNMHSGANGSITGALSSGAASKINYTGYTGGVTFDLSGTANKTTGVAGTVTLGTTTVTGPAAGADTITGTAQTYTVTGADAGNNGTISWTSFENLSDTTTGKLQATAATWTLNGANTGTVTNLSGSFTGMGNLTDTGAGTFNMHGAADGTISGNLANGANGKINYAGYTTAVTFDQSGAANKTTGVTGTVTITGNQTVTGSSNSDAISGANQTYNLTALDAGNNNNGISWTSFENLIDTVAGTFNLNAGGNLLSGTLTGGGAGTISYAAQAVAVTLDLDGVGFTAITGAVTGITRVVGGSTGGDTVTGTGKTYNLTGANQGDNGTFSWSGFENITDKTTGSFNMHSGANGSLTGNLNGGTAGTNGTMNYTGYTTAATFNLAGTANQTTGVTGTVTNVTTVVGSGNSDAVAGATQTYNLTGADTGNNGTISWSSFENLTNTGAGTFNMHSGANGSITGALSSGAASTINYTGYTTAVTFNLSGTANKTTGVAGTVTLGTTTVTGAATSDTISGTGQTYTVTGAQAGNNGTISWTSFENLADTGTGTLKAATATWTLNGAGTGTVTNLSGTFTGIANLQDTGTGSFNMHGTGDGSITGTLNGGGSGTLNYAGYTTPVTLNLNGTGYAGITGAVSNISTVVGSGNSDTVAGATQTYNMTGADTGNNGTISWSSFENLTNTGAGTFNMHSGANGSITGALSSGAASKINYTGYTGGVTFDLSGTANKTTGVAGTVTLGTTTVTGPATSDTITGTAQTYSMTGVDAGNNGTISWTSFENLTDSGAGTFALSAAGGLSGTITAVGGALSYAAYGSAVDLNLNSGSYTGFGTVIGITTIIGSPGNDTVSGNAQTYNLTGANAGHNGAISWTQFENLADAGAGTFNMHVGANGSITGNLSNASNGKIDYTGYTTGVAFNLSATANKTTGVTGTVTITGNQTVTGSGNNDTITGTAATYSLTGANTGHNGAGISWTSFENLADSGAGTFNMHSGADGSITGNLSAVAGKMDYAGYTTAVTFNLAGGAGSATGVTGTRTGITNVAGSGFSDTVTGATQTYTLTGVNAANNGSISWSSFENLTDTGNGTFNINTGGSIAGNLTNVGGTGQISYASQATAVVLNLDGVTFTGVGGTVSGINNVVGGSSGADSVTGTTKIYNLTGADAGNGAGFTWSGFENIRDFGTGTFNVGSAGSITGTGNGGINGVVSYAGHATAVTFNVSGGASTGAGSWTNVSTVTGSGGSDTITGSVATYNLTGANAGNSGATSWTSFENLTDAGAGAFNVNAGGSLTGALTAVGGTLSYGAFGTPVTLSLNGGGFTGIGGAVTGITTVTGSGGSDTVTGTGKTYNLTSANAGNNGTISWTSFENLADSGAGTFNMNGGSISGNLSSGANGRLSYAGSPTPVNVFLDAGPGGFTNAVGGTVTGINTLTGSGGSDVLIGNNRTWNLTAPNAGNTAGYTWTAFENVVDQGTTATFNGSPGSSLSGVLGSGTTTAITLNGTLTTGGQQLYSGAVTLGSTTTLVAGGSIGFGSVTGTTFNFSATAGSSISGGAIDTGTGTITLIAGGTLSVASVKTTAITPAPGNPVGTFSAGANVVGLFMDIQDAAGVGAPRQVLLTGSATSWTLTGPVGLPPDFAPTQSNVGITFNGAVLAGIGLAAQAITGSIIGGVVADAARQAVLESQQTDSVQQQVAYGFAGDVGTTPPMDHRIDETGISVPKCFNDSREGQTCQ